MIGERKSIIFAALTQHTGEKKINQIKAIFLADELHPLITDDMLELINNSVRLKRFNITFETAKP